MDGDLNVQTSQHPSPTLQTAQLKADLERTQKSFLESVACSFTNVTKWTKHQEICLDARSSNLDITDQQRSRTTKTGTLHLENKSAFDGSEFQVTSWAIWNSSKDSSSFVKLVVLAGFLNQHVKSQECVCVSYSASWLGWCMRSLVFFQKYFHHISVAWQYHKQFDI